MADLAILGQHLLNGLLIGCAYALIAIGLTMIFGVMNIANFAHGEFYMIGGFATFYLVSLLKVNYFLALPLAVVIVVVLAIIIQQGHMHPGHRAAAGSKALKIIHVVFSPAHDGYGHGRLSLAIELEEDGAKLLDALAQAHGGDGGGAVIDQFKA